MVYIGLHVSWQAIDVISSEISKLLTLHEEVTHRHSFWLQRESNTDWVQLVGEASDLDSPESAHDRSKVTLLILTLTLTPTIYGCRSKVPTVGVLWM